MPLSPTEEQQAIIQGVATGTGSLMVEAGAGCAKTTTLELASKSVAAPALSLAFNKSIAQEMAKRLPGNFLTKTMNGLGHSAWARTLPGSIKLDERKLGKLVSQVAKDRRVELSSSQWDGLRQLVSVAMTQGLIPSSDKFADQSLQPDTAEGWADLADGTVLDQSEAQNLWELAREILTANIALARTGIISYDDQIYCSTLLGGKFPQFPVVFLDEDQDLSPLNIRMVSQCLRPDGRFLAVGDKHQAIYAFRGACGDSAERIRGLRPQGEWTDFPLMTTFRCPQRVVARQQDHVPGFRAFSTNPFGEIHNFEGPRWHTDGTPSREWTWDDLHSVKVPGTLAVLCRNNAPLLSLAFKLLRRGIGCQMLGRDIGKGLASLAKKISPLDREPTGQFLAKLDLWQETEVSLALANKKDHLVNSIEDRADCLRAVTQGTECKDTGDLLALLANLFARTEGLVTLSSIHKAKGLEYSTVVHLDPWRIPSKQAKRAASAGDPIPLQQELNLRYVAETRTKHTLILANLENFT